MKFLSDLIFKTPWWILIGGGLLTLVALAVFVTPFQLIRLEKQGVTVEQKRAIKRETAHSVTDAVRDATRAITDAQREVARTLKEAGVDDREVMKSLEQSARAAKDAEKKARESAEKNASERVAE